MLEVPDGLPEQAAVIFERYARTLGDKLREEDSALLAQLSIAQATADEAAKRMFTEGLTQQDSAHGAEARRSAYAMLWRTSSDQLLKLSIELGIGPRQRKMRGGDDDKTEALDAILYR